MCNNTNNTRKLQITLSVVFLPLYLLYELSIVVVKE